MEVEIRQVEKMDIDGAYNVEKRCYDDEGASRERIEKRIAIYPNGFLVAVYEGKIVGIINGTSTDKDDPGEDALKDMMEFDENGSNILIFSLAILPEYRGRGIAKLLLTKQIENFRKLNKEKVLLICRKDRMPLYEKFGFVFIGKSKSKHGGIEWFEMALSLK